MLRQSKNRTQNIILVKYFSSVATVQSHVPPDIELLLTSTEASKREQAVTLAALETTLMTTVTTNLDAAKKLVASCGESDADGYVDR